MTLKELNSEFRSVFGAYPDKWAEFKRKRTWLVSSSMKLSV